MIVAGLEEGGIVGSSEDVMVNSDKKIWGESEYSTVQ
jgi:hypothetical protein